MFPRNVWILTFLLLAPPSLLSQEAAERPALTAVRLNPDEKIAMDGRLDEPVWERTEPATDFKQFDPRSGEPATERTEVRIAFDRDHFYMGVECFDDEPEGMLGNQMIRDGTLGSDDRFMWILDPYYNQRTGYFFEINPSGAMGDGLLAPSQGGGGGGGGGFGFGASQNRAWDGIWLARVRRHERGWTAEVEIPFRTLNFDPEVSAWGANFQRTVRRKNEESLWTAYGRNQGLFNLASAGRIEGISGVTQGVGLDVKPYVIGTYADAPGRGQSSVLKGTGGIDFFYNITPQLKTNLTVNTDFAQTEVDDRQVNLTRFPLFFPEKRDFFLDGASNFDFSREPGNELVEFFTRNIGLDKDGRPQKIDYGVKMAGQANHFDLGVLQVRTAPYRDALGEDFTVLRPKRRLLRQSYAGMIYTRRATRDSSIPVRQTIGTDFELATTRFRGSQNLQFSGFMVKTADPRKKGDNNAFGLRLNYPNDKWNARISFRDVQTNHNPAIGFVERVGYWRLNPVVRFAPRPKNSRFVRQAVMEIWSEYLADANNNILNRSFRLTLLDLNLHSGDGAQVTVTPTTYERLDRDFRIGGFFLPKGNVYRYTRYAFNVSTANRRKISGSSNLQLGTFYSGRRRDFSANLNLRPRRGLLATLNGQFNRVELAEGPFSTKILRAVVNTQFNPWISVSNNIQYDSVSRIFGWQIRFRWILQPGNDVYFVVLNNWMDTNGRFITFDRNASTKIVYTRRF